MRDQRPVIHYKKAVNVYSQLSQLVEAVGMAAHSEFEFITRKVEIARNITNGAQERLHKHKAEHGCRVNREVTFLIVQGNFPAMNRT